MLCNDAWVFLRGIGLGIEATAHFFHIIGRVARKYPFHWQADSLAPSQNYPPGKTFLLVVGANLPAPPTSHDAISKNCMISAPILSRFTGLDVRLRE